MSVWQSFGGPLYWSTLSRSPLLVSHRFSQEAKLAITKSRGSVFVTEFAEYVTKDFFKETQCWDPAITTISVHNWSWLEDVDIREMKGRFTNLAKFNPWFVGRVILPKAITAAGLRSVLRGKLDTQIAAVTHRNCCWEEWVPEQGLDLYGTTIAFSTFTRVGHNWGEAGLVENGLADQNLLIDFEITKDGCRVIKRRLSQWDKDSQSWIPGMKLARAVEMLQAKDEKH